MAAVRGLQPEFLNRLDDIVVFDALTTDELTRIVDIQVPARRPVGVSTADPGGCGTRMAALTGFDPLYGARPLRRLVQTAIGDAPRENCSPGTFETVRRCASTLVRIDPAWTSLPRSPRRRWCPAQLSCSDQA